MSENKVVFNFSRAERSFVPIKLPDGSVFGGILRNVAGVVEIAAKYSKDNGVTWSDAETLIKLSTDNGKWFEDCINGVMDKDGEIHLFLLNIPDMETELLIQEDVLTGELLDKHIDIWYVKSENERKNWRLPRKIWKGYTGHLNSVIQMTNGRILLPISYMTSRSWLKNRGEELDTFTYMGFFDCIVLYSDNNGETWALDSKLSVLAPNLLTYGGIEPVVVQLSDGRAWMLIRTQNGRFYESFSTDGIIWSRPQPTKIISSDSPAGIVRLDDGRIVLLWNKCLRYPYAYGGRHVLHAAISNDDGKSWRGSREVTLDPRRNEIPPFGGDFGTCYPFPEAVNEGKILCRTGLGDPLQIILLNPEWLLETTQEADFDKDLDDWSIFGTKGIELIAHPQKENKRVLSIQKPDPKWPASAVWNFPSGIEGELEMRIMLKDGFQGVLIGITDHFSVPFDMEDIYFNQFNLFIKENLLLPSKTKLESEIWYNLTFKWDCTKHECTILLDNQRIGLLPLLKETDGVCYLRLRSTAEQTDNAGLIIESIKVEISNNGL